MLTLRRFPFRSDTSTLREMLFPLRAPTTQEVPAIWLSAVPLFTPQLTTHLQRNHFQKHQIIIPQPFHRALPTAPILPLQQQAAILNGLQSMLTPLTEKQRRRLLIPMFISPMLFRLAVLSERSTHTITILMHSRWHGFPVFIPFLSEHCMMTAVIIRIIALQAAAMDLRRFWATVQPAMSEPRRLPEPKRSRQAIMNQTVQRRCMLFLQRRTVRLHISKPISPEAVSIMPMSDIGVQLQAPQAPLMSDRWTTITRKKVIQIFFQFWPAVHRATSISTQAVIQILIRFRTLV